jgi:hypothetical protein
LANTPESSRKHMFYHSILNTILKTLPFCIVYIVLAMGCGIKPKTNEVSTLDTFKSICDCGDDKSLLYPIAAYHDSIVLCMTGLVNGKESWDNFLHRSRLMINGTIVNCKTGDYIKTWPGFIAQTIFYSNKSLIVYSGKDFDFFDSYKNEWIIGLHSDMYEERIYSEKGVIKKSNAELIFKPLKYDKVNIKETDKKFHQKKDSPRHVNITGSLLLSALSGDSLSRKRLIAFNEIFPKDRESYCIAEYIEILNHFDQRLKEGKEIEYLDPSLYPALKNANKH